MSVSTRSCGCSSIKYLNCMDFIRTSQGSNRRDGEKPLCSRERIRKEVYGCQKVFSVTRADHQWKLFQGGLSDVEMFFFS